MVDSPEMFERYLPHAMALHVEKKWARAFEDLYKEPPDWYSGPYGQRLDRRYSSRTSEACPTGSAAR